MESCSIWLCMAGTRAPQAAHAAAAWLGTPELPSSVGLRVRRGLCVLVLQAIVIVTANDHHDSETELIMHLIAARIGFCRWCVRVLCARLARFNFTAVTLPFSTLTPRSNCSTIAQRSGLLARVQGRASRQSDSLRPVGAVGAERRRASPSARSTRDTAAARSEGPAVFAGR